LWIPWIVCDAMIVSIYFLWDTYICFPKEKARDIQRDEERIGPLRVLGL